MAAKYFPASAGATGTIVVSANDHDALSTADQRRRPAWPPPSTADHIPRGGDGHDVAAPICPKTRRSSSSRSSSTANRAPRGRTPRCRSSATRRTPIWPAPASRRPHRQRGDQRRLDDRLRRRGKDHRHRHRRPDRRAARARLPQRLISVMPIIVIGIVHQMAQALTADLADWFGSIVGPELAPLLSWSCSASGPTTSSSWSSDIENGWPAGRAPRTASGFSVERVGVVIASAGATVIAAFAALLVASLESLQDARPRADRRHRADAARRAHPDPGHLEPLGQPLFWPTPPRLRHSSRRTRSEIWRPSSPSARPSSSRCGAPCSSAWRSDPRLQDDVQPAGRAPVERCRSRPTTRWPPPSRPASSGRPRSTSSRPRRRLDPQA